MEANVTTASRADRKIYRTLAVAKADGIEAIDLAGYHRRGELIGYVAKPENGTTWKAKFEALLPVSERRLELMHERDAILGEILAGRCKLLGRVDDPNDSSSCSFVYRVEAAGKTWAVIHKMHPSERPEIWIWAEAVTFFGTTCQSAGYRAIGTVLLRAPVDAGSR